MSTALFTASAVPPLLAGRGNISSASGLSGDWGLSYDDASNQGAFRLCPGEPYATASRSRRDWIIDDRMT